MKEEMVKKKKSKAVIILAVIVVLCLGLVVTIAVKTHSKGNRLQERLEIAARYMSELDYEQAVVAYKMALEIEPMSVEAYIGLADAYMSIDNIDMAIDILRDGYDRTKDERISRKMEECYEILSEIERKKKEAEEAERLKAQKEAERLKAQKEAEEAERLRAQKEAEADKGFEDSIEFNGHHYCLIDYGYVWAEARDKCESKNAHLLTISSYEEQAFIEGLLKNGTMNSYWLGGTETADGYSWITGEEWVYSNWTYGQPDNHKNREDTLMMYNKKNPIGGSNFGGWNDIAADGTCEKETFFGKDNFGYICEWEY